MGIMISLSPWTPIDFLKIKEMGKCYRKQRRAMSFFVAFAKSHKSEIVNELSPVNMNIPLTVPNSET